MTGIHFVQIYGHTAQDASTTQVNAMCKNLKMGTVIGKTQACAISTVARFLGEKRVPQAATRVEQVSEWITMWRGFNVDIRRRIRKVWEEKAPILAKRPQTLEPSCRLQVAFGVAIFSLQPPSDTSFKLIRIGFLRGQVPGRQTVPRAELSAESTGSRISKYRLMRHT